VLYDTICRSTVTYLHHAKVFLPAGQGRFARVYSRGNLVVVRTGNHLASVMLGLLSEDRILVLVRFSVHVLTGPGVHPVSRTIDTGSLARWVNRPVRGVKHPHLSSVEVKERVQLYLYFPSEP
jgi:hypothetical protein